jgi:hypothetical protein
VIALSLLAALAAAEEPATDSPASVAAEATGTPTAPEAAPAPEAVAPAVPTTPHAWTWRIGKKGDGFVETWGQLREIASRLPDPVVDADGGHTGQSWLVDQRLRVGLALGGAGVRVATEWDLLTGNLGGTPWTLGDVDARRRDQIGTPGTLDGQVPRRASASFATPDHFLQMDVGLMPSHTWGLGILANGGERDTLFGRVDRGDRVLRLRTTVAPIKVGGQTLPLFFTFAFDRVVEDELARWRDGQAAYQVIGSVLFVDPRSGGRAGLFYTYRTQKEPTEAPRPTDAHVIDGYVDQTAKLAKDVTLRVAAEGAGIIGSTQRVLTYTDPTSSRVLSGGGALELDLAYKALAFLHLRAGVASATGDPDAGKLKDFTFDSNYNVGLVLFDELQGDVDARLYQQLGDPVHTGKRPDGADLLVTEGSFKRGAYLFPTVEVRPTGWLSVAAGWLAAWSTGPVAQPYYTFRAGGSSRNHLDQPTAGKSLLGHELDLSATLGGGTSTYGWKLRPSLKVEAGLAWPGAAMGDGFLWVGRAYARFDW